VRECFDVCEFDVLAMELQSMPYAPFTNDEQISRIFRTIKQVWNHVDEAGLVIDVTTGDERSAPPRKLDKDCTIKPCEGETAK